MDITKMDDGRIQLMSDGSPIENEAIFILGDLLMNCHPDFLAESQANDFGVCSDNGGKTYKNYAYLPYLGERPGLPKHG
jgi:hypothetical protein